MDGLSAAASGIAVVSLAIQLVDSVRQIQRFLRNVSEAPKELRRLIDLLEQLELILESIGELINKQQQNGDQDVAVSETVLRAMRTCENTVKGLASTVDEARKAVEAKSKTTKTIACFRLSCKRRDVEEFERRIQEAVSLLNLTMTANSMAVHSKSIGNVLSQVMATNQITTTISKELVLMRNSPLRHSGQSSPRPANTIETCTKRRRKTSRSETQSAWTRTPLGTIIIRRQSNKTIFDDDDEASSSNCHTRNETTWIFIPSFFSRCIDFRYSRVWGDIQGALRTYPVIRNDHSAWDMCVEGDVEGLQKLFSERQISPFSVNPWGRTLLQMAVACYNWEVCNLLFRLGSMGNELQGRGNIPVQLVDTDEAAEALEKTSTLIISQIDDVDFCIFARAFFTSRSFEPTIHLYRRMIKLWNIKENVNFLFTALGASPIPMALRMMCQSYSAAQEPWKQAIQYVLGLGVDLHATLTFTYGNDSIITLLSEVLNIADQTFEAYHLGQKWLEILSECDIDIAQYLEVEQKIRFNPSRTLPMMQRDYDTGLRGRYLVIWKDPPSVSWEWYVDPRGKAFDVLQEFKDLGMGPQDETRPDLSRDWPFVYLEWGRIAENLELGYAEGDDESRLRTFHNRCERRGHKKAMKLARAQGLLRRGPKIPGAWVD